MNGQHPGLGGPEGPPDGDYARYVERLMQRADQQRGAAQAAAKAGDALAAPAQAASAPSAIAGGQPAGRARGKAAARLPAKWPLLLWTLFVLLMWFAPALLPFAIGGLVLAGVGHSLWKARRKPGGERR
jgi:hypothetical protein